MNILVVGVEVLEVGVGGLVFGVVRKPIRLTQVK